MIQITLSKCHFWEVIFKCGKKLTLNTLNALKSNIAFSLTTHTPEPYPEDVVLVASEAEWYNISVLFSLGALVFHISMILKC